MTGLTFVPLDLHSLKCAIFLDAGSANNAEHSSQLGLITVLMDTRLHANIIHYGSIKSKRITRSVLKVELFAMVHGFDVSSKICIALNEMFGKVLPLHVFTDSRSLFDRLTKISRTAEERLLIDLSSLRQCYERREILEAS